ncbi:GNAT family N-acetyltransferase [Pseudosporangium ferrugineum]|uniref:GNAT family N-acetyltransferase n=1 Tax=Pseudosporangium ferrugineum TaxID=439699 RepID=UPI000D071695|nr:N-acetyltransferase [Pseudosporangium ferrugineum]
MPSSDDSAQSPTASAALQPVDNALDDHLGPAVSPRSGGAVGSGRLDDSGLPGGFDPSGRFDPEGRFGRSGRFDGLGGVSGVVGPVAVEGDLAELAGRCLAADGGLPLAADPGFLRRRWSGEGVLSLQVRDGGGRLVAAGAVRPTRPVPGVGDVWGGGATFAGLVDPDFRGRGLGGRLLRWGLEEGVRLGGDVTVETESLTGRAFELFAGHGLRQVFAEDVLRFDLGAGGVPEMGWPVGAGLSSWSDGDAERFFWVYEAAFRERPGFPGLSAEEWIADLVEDDEFRPGWSVLATVPGVGDAGFVTAAVGWIVQVGVVPAARGSGLGAALVTEALRRMRDDGAGEAWLDVNVDNPAARLYRRLGFVDKGRRARFRLG